MSKLNAQGGRNVYSVMSIPWIQKVSVSQPLFQISSKSYRHV